MKRIFERIESETLFGGLFGVIAIIAVVVEMVIADFDASSIAGGIKDIAGTVVTVIMLFVAINALKSKKRKAGNFQDTFDNEIKIVIEKYSPVLTYYGKETSENLKGFYRYNIANKLDSISTNSPGGNNKLFRIREGINEIEFSVSATIFGDKREGVCSRVAAKIKDSHHKLINDYKITQSGFLLIMNDPLVNEDDAKNIVKVIDHILLLYIAEYNK